MAEVKRTVETTTGFKCSIKETVLDDMRLLELIAEMQDNVMVLPKFLTLLLGEKQKDALYNHVKTKDGRVPMEPLQNEVAEILEGMGDTAKK